MKFSVYSLSRTLALFDLPIDMSLLHTYTRLAHKGFLGWRGSLLR